MKNLIKHPMFWPGLLVASPIIYFILYRLALELWCIAYGLIY